MAVVVGCAGPERFAARPRSGGDVQITTSTPGIERTEHLVLSPDPLNASQSPTSESPERLPIDLPTALRLANVQNVQIALAAERIREAEAQLDQARVLLLPNLRAGASYNHHDGRIQETSGAVVEASRSAGFTGLGAGAVGAGTVATPGVSLRVDLADAIFQPLVARQAVRAREAGSRAVQNAVLLEVVIAYEELLRAKGELAIAEEALDHATKLAEITDQFADVGEGLQSDAERAAVEKHLREKAVEQSRENVAVRAAQLAELLRLDPRVELDPTDATAAPITVVTESQPLAELVQTALQNRPELEQSRALVDAACQRLKQAKYGPLVPSVALGFSVGGFGGGTGSTVASSSDRSDFDAALYWELKNLGAGDRAREDERHSQFHQARLAEVATLDRVASEVKQAHAQVTSRRKQIASAESAVKRAMKSVELNLRRIFEKKGLPIEVLQSIQSLAAARREYLSAVIDFNEAQFRLHTALGQPASVASSAATSL